ncbi:MAG: hypothetical protein WEB03_11990 [Nitriliruptor sp.]|uniref:hypothetical protein n=1 Tax=Nitriliruptor sp. TaxID=2448056 RepID=UPI00349FE4AA
MNRALAWLLGGVLVLVLAILAIAPELLGDLSTAGSAIGIALVAIVPAVLVAVLFVSTRRRRDRAAASTTPPDRDPVTADRAADPPSDPGA